jgi:hypothetical protein
VASDELSLACRLSGLTAGDLWLRYLEIGGNRSRAELDARLHGAAWPESEDRYLAVVADEALRDIGLRLLAPAGTRTPAGLAVDVRWQIDRSRPCRETDVVREVRAHGSRLTTLFEQCRHTRATARDVRAHARTVRSTRDARSPRPTGGP